MPPTPTQSVYRPSAEVAEYVARRLVRGELLSIPALSPPLADEVVFIHAELAALFRRLRGVTVRPARQRRGLEGSIVGLRQHCNVADLLTPELVQAAREVLEPVASQADELLASNDHPFSPFAKEDATVLAAARWFKHTYFRWADPIKCDKCGGETRYTRAGEPSAEDRAGGAGRVEIHTCNSCGHDNRFPRYNSAMALMRARRGRCGEFAQLFYIFLRVLGIESRYVWNSEDHVWTEYWSPALGHWVHVDSCEAETSKPQLYDRGWGKMQRWVLAFGPLGAEDVTRAYVDDWDACLARRMQATVDGNGITENRLKVVLLTTTVMRRAGLGAPERARLAEMDAKQAAWMDDEARRDAEAERAGLKGKGRESGTKEWVEARGEGGEDTKTEDAGKEEVAKEEVAKEEVTKGESAKESTSGESTKEESAKEETTEMTDKVGA